MGMCAVQDLAPITLYTDWGLEGGVSNVWRIVQGSGSRGSDLMPPMQCREVCLLVTGRCLHTSAALIIGVLLAPRAQRLQCGTT